MSIVDWIFNRQEATKGGKGSGNFGHAGRPGEVGGSAPSGGANAGIKADPEFTDRVMKKIRRHKEIDPVAADGTSRLIVGYLAEQSQLLGIDMSRLIHGIVLSASSYSFEREYVELAMEDLRTIPGYAEKLKDPQFEEAARTQYLIHAISVVGYVDNVNGDIHLRPIGNGLLYRRGGATIQAKPTFVHECGHLIYRASQTADHWDARYNGDTWFDRRTEYSIRGGVKEGFAETYVAYVASGGRAKPRRTPYGQQLIQETFDVIDEVINGVPK